MTVGVYGEGVIDRFISIDGEHDVIGGSALNAAVALKRSGVDSVWCARVSSDGEGQAILKYAESIGVASEHILIRNEPTSIVTIATNADGLPTYGFHLEGSVDWQWTPAELLHAFSGLDVLQLSSLSCVLSPGADYLPQVLAEIRENNPAMLLTFDPNARPKAATSDGHANQMRQRIEDLIPLVDLVKVSDEDLEWLHPEISPQNAAATWSSLGPKLVVLTQGSEGATAFLNGQQIAHFKPEPISVIDTVGAGDTFMAWLIRGIVEDHGMNIPTDANSVDVLLREATKAAGITCSRKGCNPPQRAEVL
jgi:fructokinase